MKAKFEVDQSFENKIFKIILIFGTTISSINIFANFLIGFNWILNLKWIMMAGLSLLV